MTYPATIVSKKRDKFPLYRSLIDLPYTFRKSLAVLVLSIFFVDSFAQEASSIDDSKLQELKLNAKIGKPEAQYQLGRVYEEGRLDKKNLKKSFLYYTKADENNYIPAATALGKFYEYGISVKQDFTRAIHYYGKAAKADDAEGSYRLAEMYREGRGIQADTVESLKYYFKAWGLQYTAAEKGINSLPYQTYPNKNDVLYLKYMVSLDDVEALYKLGYIYLNGKGVKKSALTALPYLQKAADNNHQEALFSLANIYKNGAEGINIDKRKTVSYLFKLANLGNSEARKALLDMDYQSFASPSDVDYLTFQAVSMNNKDSQFRLFEMYDLGAGVEKNPIQALEFCQRAALQDHEEAIMVLADMYLNGTEPLKVNKSSAFQWFRKAAFIGNDSAKYILGEMYEQGIGVPVSKEKAVRWFIKTANKGMESAIKKLSSYNITDYINPTDVAYMTYLGYQGQLEAQLNLAVYYVNKSRAEKASKNESGIGVIKKEEDENAVFWLLKAVNQGSTRAKIILGDIYLNGECDVLQDVNLAFQYYTEALESGDYNANLKLAKYFLYSSAKDLDKTLSYSQSYLQSIQDSSIQKIDLSVYTVLGEVHSKQDNYKLAADAYSDYITKFDEAKGEPMDLLDAFHKRGKVYYQLRWFDILELEIETAMAKLDEYELHPKVKVSYSKLKGEWYYLLGKLLYDTDKKLDGCAYVQQAKALNVQIESKYDSLCNVSNN